MCLDSASTSSANTSSTTENKDMRIAGGNNSTLVSADNSQITVTDAGAVSGAFGFAQNALNGALAAVSANDAAVSGQVAAALDSVKSAWSDAKAGEQKVLVGMGLIIVGLVGVTALKKG